MYTKKRLRRVSILLGTLTLLILAVALSVRGSMYSGYLLSSVGQTLQIPGTSSFMHEPEALHRRMAKRLRKRLHAHRLPSPNVSKLANAIHVRWNMLSQKSSVDLVTDSGEYYANWQIDLQHHPEWLELEGSSFIVSQERIKESLDRHEIAPVLLPVHSEVKEVIATDNRQTRVKTSGIAKPGFTYDSTLLSQAAVDSLSMSPQKPYTLAATHGSLKLGDTVLPLLASGRSNYSGSTWNRSFNVQKALNEHVHNSYIEPGEIFSFNGTLDGPVTLSNGWVDGLIIVNGNDLVPSPGGGICQASTTVYRAALNAGLPIYDRKAHSLYVKYYKEYGVGIDATIFPGQQDLTFENVLESPIIVQAYHDEEKNAYVNLYGQTDGRESVLYGPYFSSTAPDDFRVRGRRLSSREIGWKQIVTLPSGEREEHIITSFYKTIPASLAGEYMDVAVYESEVLHAGAEER